MAGGALDLLRVIQHANADNLGADYTDEVRADRQQAVQLGVRGVLFTVVSARLGRVDQVVSLPAG